ncbi:MAG TPA: CUAEP/CCAEP-tail radical SAM protein [Candidatus Tectomicrobia bacterium]|nr:CUAEP/CCAEP-tail radical SAM protein [Candidatus Tectomicrobia bacterium]
MQGETSLVKVEATGESVGALRQPGAILLIACYELGHQPLGIASPLGFLEQAGYGPAAMDMAVEHLDVKKMARARFVGIAVPMHTALRLGVRLAERIRELNSTCHICCYGLYASLNAEYLLAHGADSVIGGEFEAPLVSLIEALDAGLDCAVDGVSHRAGITGPFLKPVDFRVPNRSVLPPLERYAHLERDGVRSCVGYVEASRGCKHLCLHCPIPPVYGGRFFVVSQAVIQEDIRRLVQLGAKHITFGDPDFLNGPTHALRVTRAMHAEFPTLTFDFTTKIEHILKHRDVFPEFARLGCLFVVSAVESLSDTVLANLEKGHTRADVFEALAIMRQAGITLRPSLVSFTPWTTLDDYLDVFEVVEREELIDHVDPVQYAIRLLIPPGSMLLERAAVRPFVGALDDAALSYQWTHPDPRMDTLHQAVIRLVEEAAKADEDPAITFRRVRAQAYAIRDGREPVAVAYQVSPTRSRPPRLTEPWFC